jgi:cobalt-zinc-cadmium efflux system membrane fusion protein
MLKLNKIIPALMLMSVLSITGMLFVPSAQAESGHEGHDQSQRVSVTQEQVARLGIKITRATRGIIRKEIRVPAEITVNSDRMAHVAPQISGVVLQVSAVLGQQVKKGQVLAVISSRDLAEAKTDYLASVERLKLSQMTYDREKRLYEKNVSPEPDFFAARQALAETKILERNARHKLLTFGISPSRLPKLGTEPEDEFTLYRLLSPFDGTVIQKHIVQGEVIEMVVEKPEAFVIADLSSVWVDLAISQDTIYSVQKGYTATIHLPDGSKAETKICYVPPIVDPDTRRAVAHAILDNSNGRSRPGTFVDAYIRIPSKEETVIIPKASVQLVNDRPCVFVWGKGDFELRDRHY